MLTMTITGVCTLRYCPCVTLRSLICPANGARTVQIIVVIIDAQPRPSLTGCGALLGERQLKLGGRDFDHRLALRDAVADINEHALDPAFDFRAHGDFFISEERADRFDVAA